MISDVPPANWLFVISDHLWLLLKLPSIFLAATMLNSQGRSLLCFKIWVSKEVKFFASISSNRHGILVLSLNTLFFTSTDSYHILVKFLQSIVIFFNCSLTSLNCFNHFIALLASNQAWLCGFSSYFFMFSKNSFLVSVSFSICLFLFNSLFSCCYSFLCKTFVILGFVSNTKDCLEAFLWLLVLLLFRALACGIVRIVVALHPCC